jgi:hypothetical protein
MTDREGGKKMNRLDLIIDALEKANDGWQCFDEYEKALAKPEIDYPPECTTPERDFFE